MRKRLLGLTLLLPVFLFGSLAQAAPPIMGPIKCAVWDVYDGDTFRAFCDVWPGVTIKTNVRIRGIDTPEKGGRAKCEGEKRLAQKGLRIAERIIKGRTIYLTNVKNGKYAGRILADVWVGGKDFIELMFAQGVARKYDGGKRLTWCHMAELSPFTRNHTK